MFILSVFPLGLWVANTASVPLESVSKGAFPTDLYQEDVGVLLPPSCQQLTQKMFQKAEAGETQVLHHDKTMAVSVLLHGLQCVCRSIEAGTWEKAGSVQETVELHPDSA